jgi:hypothetical protein
MFRLLVYHITGQQRCVRFKEIVKSHNQQPQEPLYQTSYMGFYIKVFYDRVEFRSSQGVQSIPMSKLAGVQVASMLIMQITIQTTDGRAYPVPTMKKQEAQQAILQAYARFVNANSPYLAMQPQYQQPSFPPAQAPMQTAPMGVPIDAEIQRIKLEIEQLRLQLSQVNANMSSVRSHYQQGHIHGGGKVGGFVRAVQRSGKDANLRKQQPVKE